MEYKIITAVLAGTIVTGALGIPGKVHAVGKCDSADGSVTTFVGADMTIAQAIDIAEKYLDGKAVGTGTEIVDGTRVFYVEVMRHGLKRKVIVDLQFWCVVNNGMAGRHNI